MDKLLEMLGVNSLDESAQTQIKEKLQSIIEVKAKEQVSEMLKKDKEELVEQYEAKFDEYKEEITSKFSNFVDSVLDEEMSVPEKVLEYAKKGELYSELIEQFKIRLAIDEGLLDEEAKSLLKEAKSEIVKLRKDLNEKIGSELELKNEKQQLEAELYLREKCDGLTEEQKEKVFSILEGITDKDEIDRKFDIVVESASDKKKPVKEEENDEEDDDEDDDEEMEEAKDLDAAAMKMAENVAKKKKGGMSDEEKKALADKFRSNMKESGMGKIEVDKEEISEEINEVTGPFKEYLNSYMKVLKDNKI